MEKANEPNKIQQEEHTKKHGEKSIEDERRAEAITSKVQHGEEKLLAFIKSKYVPILRIAACN